MTTAELLARAPVSARAHRRIVIVDDSAEDRAEVRRLLLQQISRGYQIVDAETGHACVSLVLSGGDVPPYCIVLDHNLPDMDAPAVLAALTTDGQLYCPVVVLTGNDDGTTARHVLRAGAQDFIGKSWMTAPSLLRAVENAVERFEMVRELRAKNAAIIEMQLNAAELLRNAAQRKDEFLATLAHELRNPLAPLTTGLELMDLQGDAQSADIRAMMMRQLRTLVHLVDDLLDVSRIGSGKVNIRGDLISLQSAVENAVEMSRPLISAAKQQLEICLPGSPVWVVGDHTRLAQVVSNLLNNATRYSASGANIRLHLSVRDANAILEVTDDGIGIAPDLLPHVFDLFMQADQGSDRAAGGLGIGLALVDRFVRMHSGHVQATSKGLGHGSTFTITLPVAPEPEDAPNTAPALLTNSALPSPRRVLVVDDNMDAAESLADVLRLSGHSVRTCHDGNKAVVVAREFEPHAAFIDLGLPGMHGEAVARAVRATEAGAHMLLVAVTGWGNDEDKRKTKLAGFDVHLTKPAHRARVEEALALLDTRTDTSAVALGA